MLAIDGRARSSGLNWRRDRAPAAGIEPLPLSPKELKNESEGVSLETYRSNLVLTCPLFRQARAQRLQALW